MPRKSSGLELAITNTSKTIEASRLSTDRVYLKLIAEQTKSHNLMISLSSGAIVTSVSFMTIFNNKPIFYKWSLFSNAIILYLGWFLLIATILATFQKEKYLRAYISKGFEYRQWQKEVRLWTDLLKATNAKSGLEIIKKIDNELHSCNDNRLLAQQNHNNNKNKFKFWETKIDYFFVWGLIFLIAFAVLKLGY